MSQPDAQSTPLTQPISAKPFRHAVRLYLGMDWRDCDAADQPLLEAMSSHVGKLLERERNRARTRHHAYNSNRHASLRELHDHIQKRLPADDAEGSH